MKKKFNTTALFFIMAFYIFIPIKANAQQINTADLLPKFNLIDGLLDTVANFNLNNGEWKGRMHLKSNQHGPNAEATAAYLERDFTFKNGKVVNEADTTFGIDVTAWLGLVSDTNMIKVKGSVEEVGGEPVLTFKAVDKYSYYSKFVIKDGESVQVYTNDGDSTEFWMTANITNVKKEGGQIVSATLRLSIDMGSNGQALNGFSLFFDPNLNLDGTEWDTTGTKARNWVEITPVASTKIMVRRSVMSDPALEDVSKVLMIKAHNGYYSSYYQSPNGDLADSAFFKSTSNTESKSVQALAYATGQGTGEFFSMAIRKDFYEPTKNAFVGFGPGGNTLLGITFMSNNSKLIVIKPGDANSFFLQNDGVGFVIPFGCTSFENGSLYYGNGADREFTVTSFGTDTLFNGLEFHMKSKDTLFIYSREIGSLQGKKLDVSFSASAYDKAEPAVSVTELKTVKFQIFPNPANSKLTIESDKALEYVEIYNTLGMRIWSGNYKDTKAEIDIENFAPGIYFIRLYKTGDVMKIVIEK